MKNLILIVTTVLLFTGCHRACPVETDDPLCICDTDADTDTDTDTDTEKPNDSETGTEGDTGKDSDSGDTESDTDTDTDADCYKGDNLSTLVCVPGDTLCFIYRICEDKDGNLVVYDTDTEYP